VKVAAGMGVEVRQIYSAGRRSRHPNNAPHQTDPNPNYSAEEQGPPSSCRWSGGGKGDGCSRWRLEGSFRSVPPLARDERNRLA
jgi:hypothetical protein